MQLFILQNAAKSIITQLLNDEFEPWQSSLNCGNNILNKLAIKATLRPQL